MAEHAAKIVVTLAERSPDKEQSYQELRDLRASLPTTEGPMEKVAADKWEPSYIKVETGARRDTTYPAADRV